MSSERSWLAAKDPRTPTAQLIGFARLRVQPGEDGWDVRSAAIETPSLPVDVLNALADDHNSSVRCFVARNPSTPKSTLLTLSRDPDADVRSYVGNTPHTPPEILTQLARDPAPEVRHSVGVNPGSPVEILDYLMRLDTAGRIAVSQNRATPSSMLREMALDPHKGVRSGVAWNPNTPADVLSELARDQEEIVRKSASLNSNTGVPSRAGAETAKGGCYIATAVYGSYDAAPVVALRRFRDEQLTKSVMGRAFIRTYYAVSPGLAKYFARPNLLNHISKNALDSIVRRLE